MECNMDTFIIFVYRPDDSVGQVEVRLLRYPSYRTALWESDSHRRVRTTNSAECAALLLLQCQWPLAPGRVRAGRIEVTVEIALQSATSTLPA